MSAGTQGKYPILVLMLPPSQGVAPPLTRGQGVLPQDGVLQREPTDQGTGAVRPPCILACTITLWYICYTVCLCSAQTFG